MQDDIFNVFKYEGILKTLLVFPAKETIVDPDEGTTTKNFLNPVPIKAVISQLGVGALKWKYWGNLPVGSIQVICDKKYYNLFLMAGKVEFENETYYVYTDDAKRFSIIKRRDYIYVILEKKNS